MKTFSATDAAISGFVLVREHPKAVGAWVILSTIVSAILTVAVIGLFGSQLQAFAELNSGDDPMQALTAMAGLAPMFLLSTVYNLAFYSVLLSAIYRVMLRPSDPRQAYLRFGADELRQAGVSFLIGLMLVGAYVAVIVLVVGLAAAAPLLGALAALVLIPAFLWAVLYFGIRLSLANVLTFTKGKIDIFGSMALTKGRFWPILGSYVVAVVLGIVVYLLLFLIVTLLGAAISGFNMDTLSQLTQSQTMSLETLMTPTGVLKVAIGGVVAVLTSVTIYAPAAFIFRAINIDPEVESEYFA
jgi:hypothetical protein